jgi:hypothetical protein
MNGFSFWLQPLPVEVADRRSNQQQDSASGQEVGGGAESAREDAAHAQGARANAGNRGPDVGWDALVAHLANSSHSHDDTIQSVVE